ncbi:MAG: hypothetical protein WBX02_06330 [Terriglobales bacterium]
MQSRLPSLRSVIFSAALVSLSATLVPNAAWAQDDPPPLGDIARDLRKSKSQKQTEQPDTVPTVIDNDNLAQVMEDAKNARPIKPEKTVFSIDPSGNTLKVSSPDVTCSLSFNAKASALLIRPVLIEDLPLPELLKIDGPGSIQDENLQLEVFNGTDWELREITIGLTLERKPGENAELAARARVIPAAEGLAPVTVERRSDVTLLYHLKAEAKPFSTTAFHEDIGITPGPDEDWRWSIVEARGIRPAQAPAAPDSLTEPLIDPLFSTPSSVPESNQPPLLPSTPAPQP